MVFGAWSLVRGRQSNKNYGLQITIHHSRFTKPTHHRITIHDSRFTIHESLYNHITVSQHNKKTQYPTPKK